MLDEELNSNPQVAAKNYQAIISSFDQQRWTAAQAIFRLGELNRRMGRIDEARLMYARILREFVDFPDLAKLSQQLLTENAPAQPRGSLELTATPSNPAEEELIREELALLETQLAENEKLVKVGLAGSNSGLSLKREILQLKQRLARTQTQGWTTTMPANSLAAEVSSSRPGRGVDPLDDRENLQIVTDDLKRQIALLSGEAQPENISAQLINDPRFAELKGNYETALLNASGDENSQKTLVGARDRLVKWIQEIYLPELKSTLAIKKTRLEALEKRSEPIKR